jgi:hypothetical protein
MGLGLINFTPVSVPLSLNEGHDAHAALGLAPLALGAIAKAVAKRAARRVQHDIATSFYGSRAAQLVVVSENIT